MFWFIWCYSVCLFDSVLFLFDLILFNLIPLCSVSCDSIFVLFHLILYCSVLIHLILFSSVSFDFFVVVVPFHLILLCSILIHSDLILFLWFSSYLLHLVLLLYVLFYSVSFSSALLFSETILPESYTYAFAYAFTVNRLGMGSIMPLSNHPSIHLFPPPSWAKYTQLYSTWAVNPFSSCWRQS